MKPWLHHPSLTHMEWFFAGEQSIAKHKFRALHHNTAVLHGCIAYQDFMHHVRMIELEDMPSKRLVVDNVSERLRIPLEKLVGAESQKSWIAQAVTITRAGRIVGAGNLSQGKFNFLSCRAFLRSSLLQWTASD
jgi:hypothetical protein